jgi:hypothetical protein
MFSVKAVLKIFSSSLEGTAKAAESRDRLDCLVRSSLEANRRLWNLEDSARMVELGSEHVAKAKQRIDESNQIRNDLVREIDAEISNEVRLKQPNPRKQRYSETPGMIIDRLSILYIKLSVIRDLLMVIKERDLKKEYQEKEKLISGQIERLGNFLDSFFHKLKDREASFEVQQPVKIYNDARVRKYIVLLRKIRSDL